MSEHLPIIKPETKGEQDPEQHQSPEKTKRAKHSPEADSTHSDTNIDVIRQSVEQSARSATEIQIDKASDTSHKQHFYANKELKAEALRRILNRTRKRLSPPEQLLSKTVHKPVVDFISTASEKTIARPYPLLAAGTMALLGSGYMLYASKHHGHSYNYLFVFIIFAAAYAGGLLAELCVHLLGQIRKSR